MIAVRSLTVILLVLPLIMQSDGNEKVYETYFNGYCYWSEEVAYHVHYSSGCKVYFTCQRGKFLDFHRCPDSTVFNIETRKCDSNGICKDRKIENPAYEAWWGRVVSVIDDVVEALKNSSTAKRNGTSSTSTTGIPQIELEASTVPLSPSNQTITQTKTPIGSTDFSFNLFKSASVNNPSTRESASLSTVTETISDSTKGIPSKQAVRDIPTFDVMPSSSVAKSTETKPKPVHLIPMQFEIETSLLTDDLHSSVAPFKEEIAKAFEQLGLPPLETIINSTRETDIMSDLIIPLVRDILKNATIMEKVDQLMDVLFETADPLLYQLLDQQADFKKGSTITISLKDLKDTWDRATIAARPIFKELFRYLHPMVFGKIAESGDIILNYLARSNSRMLESIPSILWTLHSLNSKYYLSGGASEYALKTTYPLIEIRQDVKELFRILYEAFRDDKTN